MLKIGFDHPQGLNKAEIYQRQKIKLSLPTLKFNVKEKWNYMDKHSIAGKKKDMVI